MENLTLELRDDIPRLDMFGETAQGSDLHVPDSGFVDTTTTPSTSTTKPMIGSYTSRFTSPPVTVYPYTHDVALTDLPGVSYALELFLSSKMFESEAYLKEQDKDMERLYVATGFGLIQCVKGLMSYEDAVSLYLSFLVFLLSFPLRYMGRFGHFVWSYCFDGL